MFCLVLCRLLTHHALFSSSWLLTSSHVHHGLVLGNSVLVDVFVVEAAEGWADIVPLSHLEVLSKVLVSAPPVGVDHADSLISSHLMEVGVSHIVLLAISWKTSVGVRVIIVSIVFTNVPSPLRDHVLLLLFGKKVKHERLIQMENEQHVEKSDSVLILKGGNFPEGIAEWILEEPGNVFEGSPSLSVISWFGSLVHEFAEITVSFFSE